jgi:hypothetical protein
LTTDVKQGLGHCHRIWTIYQAYLNKWFSKVLAKDEHDLMTAVFMDLGNADDDLFADLGQVAETLQTEAEAVLDLVIKGQKNDARTRVLTSLPALRAVAQDHCRHDDDALRSQERLRGHRAGGLAVSNINRVSASARCRARAPRPALGRWPGTVQAALRSRYRATRR